jgi:photosystem II stability/assembly factor-like uncharacterized protein
MIRSLRKRVPLVGTVVVGAGLAIGAVIAVLSSPTSLLNHGSSYSPEVVSTAAPEPTATSIPSPTPVPSPVPKGTLGADVAFFAVGSQLIAIDSAGIHQSTDQGQTWTAASQPKGAAGIVVDRSDPNFRLAGGATLLVTTDGGASWKPPKAQPSGAASVRPLMVNPGDNTVWFVVGNGQLLRTRDGGVSWKAITGLPGVTSARMAATGVADQFILTIGGQVFELLDNGNQVKPLPALPAGSAIHLAVVGAGDPPPIVAVADNGHAYAFRAGAWTDVVGLPVGPLDGLPSGRAWIGDGGTNLSSPGWILTTADGGATWRAANGLPNNQSIDAIAGLGSAGSQVWAYAAGGDVYGSTDGGATWRLVAHAFRSA